MPIIYTKLFELLKEKGYTTYKIRQEKLIGQGTLTALKNGTGGLDAKTIARLCEILDCQPGDLMEYVKESNQMLSKEMYDLLMLIPRHPKHITFSELDTSTVPDAEERILEAHFYDYINTGEVSIRKAQLSRTEKGQAVIEDFEMAQRNQKMVEQSLSVAKHAKWAAIASAVVAAISLLVMLFRNG